MRTWLAAFGLLASCAQADKIPQDVPADMCGPWMGSLESPTDFESDEIVGPVVQAAGDDIHLGGYPPDVDGEYCAEIRLVALNGDPASGTPAQTRIRLFGQTENGDIQYLETNTGIRAEADGFITGQGADFTCDSVIGCHVGGVCTGTASGCSGRSQSGCSAGLGCYWTGSTCAGSPFACNLFFDYTGCEDQPGCNWGQACTGTPTPCAEIDTAQCEEQSGCSVVPE